MIAKGFTPRNGPEVFVIMGRPPYFYSSPFTKAFSWAQPHRQGFQAVDEGAGAPAQLGQGHG